MVRPVSLFTTLILGLFSILAPTTDAAIALQDSTSINFNSSGAGGYTGERKDCDLVCQKEQRSALLLLFQATNGKQWRSRQGWIKGDVTSHCGWYGVHCCTDDNTIVIKYITAEGWTVTYGNSAESFGQYCPVTRGVAALTLSLNQLSGTLPEEVFYFFSESLQYLDLHGNNIKGGLPKSLGALTSLRELSLNSNRMVGTIPNSLGQLSHLIALNLGANKLSGTLPVALGELKGLRWLVLNDNMLTGPVPFFVFGIKSLKIMDLADNRLSGSITDVRLAFVDIEIPYLLSGHNIEELRIRNNEVEGTIPSTITSLPLTVMDLGGNRFSGTIPPTIARSPFLETLLLDNNRLRGNIPRYLSKWNLKTLDLSNNNLTGSIPPSLAIRTLASLNLGNNSISGPIPDAFKDMHRLQYFDIGSNIDMGHESLNSRGERLPEYLKFNELGQFPQVDSHGRSRNLNCPHPIGSSQNSELKSFQKVVISPEYFGFQQCECADNEIYTRQEVVKDGVVENLKCIRNELGSNATPWTLILMPVFLLGVMIPMALWTWSRYSATLARVQMNLKKRKGPPGTDRKITLVLTDVEGSTELWEWNTEVMALSIDIHDKVMRSQLSKFYGYEITTEGDAFLVAFHESSDALAWCLSLQYALLAAAWPAELMGHQKATVQTAAMLESAQSNVGCLGDVKAQASSTQLLQTSVHQQHYFALMKLEQVAHDKDLLISGLRDLGVIFRGLRVRMGLATGIPESMKIHKMTMRAEYFGDVVRRVQAVSDTPHGGQVVMDQETFSVINCCLDEVGAMVAEAIMSHSGRSEQAAHKWQNHFTKALGRVQPRLSESEAEMLCGEETLCRLDFQNEGEGEGKLASENTGALVQESLLQSRASEIPDSKEYHAAWAKSRASTAPTRSSSLSGAVKVIDMGIHKLKGIAQPNNLVQAAVPGLEERARFFPPLDSEAQLSPGYFDAAATRDAPLDPARIVGHRRLPPVTLVFCTIEGFSDMQAHDKLAAEEVLTIYNDCIRRTLLAVGGYECQEQEGNYMISFAAPDDAVEWCLMVQEVLMEIDWTRDALKLPGAQEQVDSSGVIVFRGPRVKMGIYEGIPTRAVPHSTTGRADYFGQFVNRAARFCHAASRGGQVITSLQVMEKIVARWKNMDEEELPHLYPLHSLVVVEAKPKHGPGQFGSEMGISPSASADLQQPQGWQQHNKAELGVGCSSHSKENRSQKEIGSFPGGGADVAASSTCGAVEEADYGPGGGSVETGDGEPRYMSSFSVACRIKDNHWSWVGKLEVEDLGSYRFKGVTGSHKIVSVKSQRLIARKFGSEIRQGKGEKLEGGSGVIVCITMLDKAEMDVLEAENEDILNSENAVKMETQGSGEEVIKRLPEVRVCTTSSMPHAMLASALQSSILEEDHHPHRTW